MKAKQETIDYLKKILPNFDDKKIENFDLEDANLNGANLSDANLSDANLSGAYLRNADLSCADLRDAYLRNADLSYTNLNGANLSDANLSDANLSGANLSCADLRDANLSDANLSGANLSGADLSGSKNLISQTELINKFFKKDKNGFIVYKIFGLHYNPPSYWKIAKGSIIKETVNLSNCNCACGISFCSLNNIDKEQKYWKCRIAFEDLIDTIVFNCGTGRCGRLELLEKIN